MNNKQVTYEIWLPSLLPPSLNGWYAGGKGAAFKRAKVARQWHEYLAYLPEFRALPVFQNKIKIRVKLWFPNRIRRDHLNFSTPAIKFIEDTLVLMGKIADDSPEYMEDSGMGQIMPVEKGKVGTLVTIEEV